MRQQQQYDSKRWKDFLRDHVRVETKDPNARVSRKGYGWSESHVLVEGDDLGDPKVSVSTALVCNNALAAWKQPTQSLSSAVGDAGSSKSDRALALLEAAVRKIFELPEYRHAYTAFVDDQGSSMPPDKAVQVAAEILERRLPHVVEMVYLAAKTPGTASGAAASTGAHNPAAAAAAGAAAAAPAASGAAGAEDSAAPPPAAAAAAAGEAGAAAAAATRKRPLTDSQRDNLTKKKCQACSQDIAPRSIKCEHCHAEQVLKTAAELAQLLQPLQPYMASGEVPLRQRSTQALANVEKRLQHPMLLKQVKAAAADTGLEILVIAVGPVKCAAELSPVTRLHQSGTYVVPVPVEPVAEPHRLVMISHSTGGPMRSAMERACLIPGLKDDAIPADVKLMRQVCQTMQKAAHDGLMASIRSAAPAAAAAAGRGGSDGVAAAAAVGRAGSGVPAGPNAAAAAGVAAAGGNAAADAANSAPGVGAGLRAGDGSPGAAAAAANSQQPPAPAAAMPDAAADVPPADGPPAPADAAPMQPPQLPRMVGNYPAPAATLEALIKSYGFSVLLPDVARADEALYKSVMSRMEQGLTSYALVKRELVQAVEVPVVYLATGFVSIYEVVTASGTGQVQIPQVIRYPNTCLSREVLEQCLQAGPEAAGTS